MMLSKQPSSITDSSSSSTHLPSLGIVALFIAIAVGILAATMAQCNAYYHYAAWAMAQWLPATSSLRHSLQLMAWKYWETSSSSSVTTQLKNEDSIPSVNVQEHLDDLLPFLEKTFGKNWRRRPLLLQNLWTKSQLDKNHRHISLNGLLQENLVIPYFTNATRTDALTPDAMAPIQDIVANITKGGPQKIGTQLLVQTYPELISEVAPTNILTTLWGDYFQPHHVRGMGPFGISPALTTVPIFVASGSVSSSFSSSREDNKPGDDGAAAVLIDNKDEAAVQQHSVAYTALHCEPIGNVAVQLSGRKKWILVQPEYSFLIRPSTSPDGRAFFASWSRDDYMHRVPTYTTITQAGDAIWVPTWTWHRVDYIDSEEIAIGGSLFHFRPLEFVRNNPLFAVLMVPAMFLELIGYSTQ